MPERASPGLYETPITVDVEQSLAPIADALKDIADLDPASSPRMLARLVQERMTHALAAVAKGEAEAALAAQLALTNQVLTLLQTIESSGAHPGHHLAPPARLLRAIKTPSTALGQDLSPVRPALPLSTSALMTNAHKDVAIGPARRDLSQPGPWPARMLPDRK